MCANKRGVRWDLTTEDQKADGNSSLHDKYYGLRRKKTNLIVTGGSLIITSTGTGVGGDFDYTANVWKGNMVMWFRFLEYVDEMGSMSQLFPGGYYELERTVRPVKAEFSIGRKYFKTAKF